jgi:AcrR family transcriptional regulator
MIRSRIALLGDSQYGTVSFFGRSAFMSDEDKAQKWVTAGLAELSRSGIDGVRVEVLAQQMGVTKGGFYRQFKDRDALLKSLLDRWIDGRLEAIKEQMELKGETPQERLRSVLGLFTRRVNTEGIAIELAIRQWARSNKSAARAVEQVDAARLKLVSPLYRSLGFSPVDADARALLFYSFLFGQSLLLFSTPPARRKTLLLACAAVLIPNV